MIEAQIDPEQRTLNASVRVTLPAGTRELEFLLASSLVISEAEPVVEVIETEREEGFVGINGSAQAMLASNRAKRYRVRLAEGQHEFQLRYQGKVDFGFETPSQEYARGFSETAGTINSQGTYLAGSTLWYPWIGSQLLTFELSARSPEGWHLISPGSGSSRDEQGVSHWSSASPVDELHIVGGPLTRYSRSVGAATAEVYLREPDPVLAAKYLESTARNLEMYRQMLGPYPYDKFALVENFWETGYGMPSFTLLGPQIIRFPFILTSSYPHEILHNWWGNGVFVDYDSGNWCEGLTAYHADHLYKEQAGQGADYRRDTLKKYRDFVREARDFPLTEFRSRHSPATEAVGYGKALMTYHMLRRQVGDTVYLRGLQRFYREQRGKQATFMDLASAHGAAAGVDLDAFMQQWITRSGAPTLRLENVQQHAQAITGTLLQVQNGGAFVLQVPVIIRTVEGIESFMVSMTEKSVDFRFDTAATPLALEVDPEFDLFRLLDARETAPSLGQMFGEPEVLAIFPAAANPAEREAFQSMIDFWGGGKAQNIKVQLDQNITELPKDQPVWIFGTNNTWATQLYGRAEAIDGFAWFGSKLRAGKEELDLAQHSAIIVRRHPLNSARAVAWVALASPSHGAAVARKLPHYGKYSWLGFEATEARNIAKGEWPTSDSPLKVDLRTQEERDSALPSGGYPQRSALARLPEVFDEARMQADVTWLAAPEREGRGMGTAGLEEAAQFIEQAFREAGLKPLGMAKDYAQAFEFTPAGAKDPIRLTNILGVLPGTDPRLADEVVVLSAHYDHLGRSGPGVRMSQVGQVHPGADDNASGVAVMLELARTLAAAGSLPRSVVFAAFSGEEAGLQGARHFMRERDALLPGGVLAAINLDTVGRAGTGGISALATGTATEWVHVFRGIGFATGISVKTVEGAGEASDQQAFIEAGIPAVQLFTGAHFDYHQPSDTADKIDSAGLVQVASVSREAVTYLAQRPNSLTSNLKAASETSLSALQTSTAVPARRVSFGLVPDYVHQGAGVKAESVVPESPAERAGMQAGDVLLSLNGKPVMGLGGFSDLLKTYQAGDQVRAKVVRAGVELEMEVSLVER